MDDVIYRQAAIDKFEPWLKVKGYNEGELNMLKAVLYELKCLPSAEPKRKKGKWQITDAYPHNVYCPECHVKFAQTHWAVWEDGSLPRNFCPNCGAEMG